MKVLYVCTHNRCRSILAEALTRQLGGDLLQAKSAGSSPSGEVHPLTLHYLEAAGVAADGLASESWDAHELFAPDVVVTVCDKAAGEACPIWFGPAIRLHWGLPDPSAITTDTDAQARSFAEVMGILVPRIEQLREIAAQPRDQWQVLLVEQTVHD